jgi:UDP-2-acetamido-3-amino-2,3-dideoxy-glucuronate N-acetyltransferase
MAFFQHQQALVESQAIGDGTRVWAFAHILPGARVGRDCNICDHVFIENDVVVGDRVTIKSGVQLWDGVRLEDDVFVGPNATFTNDPFPRSRNYQTSVPVTTVRRGASIGANATLLPGITIGAQAMIGAGAVVMHDVPANAIVYGNPAHIRGYVDSHRVRSSAAPSAPAAEAADADALVRGVTIITRQRKEDLRGSLSVLEVGSGLPFVPQRYFVVSNVPSRQVRGEHAHLRCQQLLTCVNGECRLLVDDGARRQEIRLTSPEQAVYVPPMIWGVQFDFSADAVLLVLASDLYDPSDYIRDYDEFLSQIQSRPL